MVHRMCKMGQGNPYVLAGAVSSMQMYVHRWVPTDTEIQTSKGQAALNIAHTHTGPMKHRKRPTQHHKIKKQLAPDTTNWKQPRARKVGG